MPFLDFDTSSAKSLDEFRLCRCQSIEAYKQDAALRQSFKHFVHSCTQCLFQLRLRQESLCPADPLKRPRPPLKRLSIHAPISASKSSVSLVAANQLPRLCRHIRKRIRGSQTCPLFVCVQNRSPHCMFLSPA